MIQDAVECDLIKAVNKGQYMNVKIFLVTGKTGFYRQVSRNGRTGLHTPVENAIVVQRGDKLVELVRWDSMEQYVRAQSQSSSSRTSTDFELISSCTAGEALPKPDSAPAPSIPNDTMGEQDTPPNVSNEIRIGDPVPVTKTTDAPAFNPGVPVDPVTMPWTIKRPPREPNE